MSNSTSSVKDFYSPVNKDDRFPYTRFFAATAQETELVFQSVMERTPYEFQKNVRDALAAMSQKEHPLRPSSVLLVRPTGGGKSSVYVSHSMISAGFLLNIVPLLSLGVDQQQKVKEYKSDETSGITNAYHLDDFRDEEHQKPIVDDLLKIKTDTKQTIFLFSSPQAIVNSPLYQKLIATIIEKKLLRLVTVDEIHLYTSFGLSFRQEFVELTKYLFEKLRLNSYNSTAIVADTKVPILWMTATASESIISELQNMTRVSIAHNPHCIFWPNAEGMYNPRVSIDVAYSSAPISKFKALVIPILETDRKKKFVWYTNNLYSLEQNMKNILLEFDGNPNVKADMVPLSGDLVKEQKMWHILVFCRDNSPNLVRLESSSDKDRPFNAQLLMATSGSANAGIDCQYIHGVGRGEFPPSVRDLMQELGRAGRWIGADGCWYFVAVSLESYCSLIRRTFHSFESGTTMSQAYYDSLLDDMKDVLSTLVVPTQCIHWHAATLLQNPYNDACPSDGKRCGDKCSFSRGEYGKMYAPVSRAGLTQVLMDIFMDQRYKYPSLTVDDTLIEAIRNAFLFPPFSFLHSQVGLSFVFPPSSFPHSQGLLHFFLPPFSFARSSFSIVDW